MKLVNAFLLVALLAAPAPAQTAATMNPAVGSANAFHPLPLRTVAEVPLTGGATRLDYQAVDPSRGLLFIAHMGDGAVIVVDMHRRSIVKTISKLDDVHGVLVEPQHHIVYVSATGRNEIAAIDERTLNVIARIPGGDYPDGMAYDPKTQRLFVSDERGRTETVIDTQTKRRIATIGLRGEVGNSTFDPDFGRIYVNIQTTGLLIAIDPRTLAIIGRIGVQHTGCIGNHGLAIDRRYRRAFVACEDSATLLAVDLRTGRITGTWPIGEAPDVLALDPARRLLYVASESGTVSVFRAQDTVTPVGQGLLAAHAHTVAVDLTTHLIYFPLENIAGKPTLRVMEFVQ